MRIFYDLPSLHGQIINPAVTVGSFDGVHAGHREILSCLRQCAARQGGESVVVTFDPHPRQVIQQEQGVCLLNSLEEKIDLFEHIGIDNVLVIPFTPEFSRLSSAEFARRYLLEGIGAKTIVMGYNHHFGFGREGNRDYLEALRPEYDFEVCQLPKHDVADRKVSSTVLRSLIQSGDMASVNELLTEPYFFIARLSGNGLLEYGEPLKLFPPEGTYPVEVENENSRFRTHLLIAPGKVLTLSDPVRSDGFADQKWIVRFL